MAVTAAAAATTNHGEEGVLSLSAIMLEEYNFFWEGKGH
jgi:hypothetical protein